MSAERDPQAVPTFDPLEPRPLVEGHQTLGSLTTQLLHPVFQPPGRLWWTLFLLCTAGVALLGFAVIYTLIFGIEVWGNNIPVAWGFGITNFVWWIGFAHAGTLISAILVLFQQKWRAPIHRFAEAMALASIIQAGLFPLLHLGRPWFSYWLAPYPSTLNVWPQFKSSLTWDTVAVLTYLSVTFMFWYVGMIPDLAAARDHAPTVRRRRVYALLAMGWTGGTRQWHQWKISYRMLAGIGTALVLSVESVVSFDFTIALVPGWHVHIFPPYFVASAMFSGFALLLLMILPTRVAYGLEHVITPRHLATVGKMILLFSFFVLTGYVHEHFFGWYGGDPYEIFLLEFKRSGFYSPLWYLQITCTVLLPQLLWIPRLRHNVFVLWGISLAIVVGAWLEQFLHVVPSLARDFLPSSWKLFFPTWVDWSILVGTISLFGFLMLLFGRFLPPVPIAEVKESFEELVEHKEEKKHELQAGVA